MKADGTHKSSAMSKYRNESIRLQGWDYRNAAAYFITICTGNRIRHFGKCRDGQMQLSTMGLIVQGCWYEIPRFNKQVELGAFIVMPDHLHGILILNTAPVGTWQCRVPTRQNNVPTKKTEPDFYRKITPPPGSVSVIIGSFKSACTRHIRRAFPEVDFAWQERFYDHIIRNDGSYTRISNYIINNPKKWNKDK